MRAEFPAQPPITDAQVHVWPDSTAERPSPDLGIEPQRVSALSADELVARMDTVGVLHAVLVRPTWEGSRNDLALAAAATHPGPFAVMGRVDPGLPSAVASLPTWGLACTYEQYISLFVREMPRLTPEDLNWIMGEGVSAWLNWPRVA